MKKVSLFLAAVIVLCMTACTKTQYIEVPAKEVSDTTSYDVLIGNLDWGNGPTDSSWQCSITLKDAGVKGADVDIKDPLDQEWHFTPYLMISPLNKSRYDNWFKAEQNGNVVTITCYRKDGLQAIYPGVQNVRIWVYTQR